MITQHEATKKIERAMARARNRAYRAGDKAEVQRLNVALFMSPRVERTLDEIFADAAVKAAKKAARARELPHQE